jgi:hypothetical protein
MMSEAKGNNGGNLRGWILLLCLCAALVGWGMAQFWLVKDSPRAWNHGALPEAPGESAYSSSTTRPASAPAPRQLAPLPEARPAKPLEGRP